MTFLANENFPLDAVEILRNVGHDVAWVRSDAPGLADSQVLAWAMRDRRVLLTFDKDFGDLAFHAGLPADCGIILFRLGAATSAELAAIILAAIQSRNDWGRALFGRRTEAYSDAAAALRRPFPIALPHLLDEECQFTQKVWISWDSAA